MYAAGQFFGTRIMLEDYRITSHDGRRSAYSGDTLSIARRARGYLRVRVQSSAEGVSFGLVRWSSDDQEAVEADSCSLESAQPGHSYEWSFDVPVPTGRAEGTRGGWPPMGFYRVLGYSGATVVMATNPIFVRQSSPPTPRSPAAEPKPVAPEAGSASKPPISRAP